MVDVVGQAAWYLSLPLGLAVAGLLAHWLRGAWLPARIAASALLGTGVALFLLTMSWAMALRDGLGPDMVATAGLTALRRSLHELSVEALLMAAALAVGGLILALLCRRTRHVAVG